MLFISNLHLGHLSYKTFIVFIKLAQNQHFFCGTSFLAWMKCSTKFVLEVPKWQMCQKSILIIEFFNQKYISSSDRIVLS